MYVRQFVQNGCVCAGVTYDSKREKKTSWPGEKKRRNNSNKTYLPIYAHVWKEKVHVYLFGSSQKTKKEKLLSNKQTYEYLVIIKSTDRLLAPGSRFLPSRMKNGAKKSIRTNEHCTHSLTHSLVVPDQ